MSDREFEIEGTPPEEVEIGATGLRSIIQNIKTIVSTWRTTVFGDRQFGLDTKIIDMPATIVQAQYSMDITTLIERNEPRVNVISVTFSPSDINNGQIIPLIRVRIRNGVLL